MLSSKLTEVFNTLPSEAQQMLVEKHLAGLLDLMPKEKSKKVLAAATRLQRKFNDAPKLDLRSKRKEITSLLDELTRDAKISFIKERSNRDELLSEVVHSLVSWLNDIWSIVYEYNVNFLLAHTCLLFVADALAQLSESSSLGGCKCSVMNLPVDFTLRDKHGKIVKRFSVMGPQNLDRILLWIWRDLFVSLFAKGTEREKKKVPDFLEDIEALLGVHALERLLYGGRPSEPSCCLRLLGTKYIGEDESEEEDEEDEEYEDEDEEDDYIDGDHSCEDDDSDYDADGSDRCTCNFHASYWSEHLNKERIPLRVCVEKRLFSIFEVTPSLGIYNTLLNISHNALEIEMRISRLLSKIAGDTADNLVAALDIHIANHETASIASLLKSHSYLLRPRDAVTLQVAVAMLADSEYRSRSLAILEKELEDCIRAIYASVHTCFSHIEDDANKKDLLELLKLPIAAASRKERVQQWAERVITATNGPMHPMAFAAMMMGLPMMPGTEDGDDADMLNYVDLDRNDPDLDDLREEYRPELKGIFEGWTQLGQTMKGGPVILAKLYVKAIEMMPWLRGSDVVTEMTNRLRDRPNKSHVLDALVNLSTFAKMQRKKLSLARGEQRRNKPQTASSPAAGRASGSPSSTSTPSFPLPPTATHPTPTAANIASFGIPLANGAPQPPFRFPPIPGGMEDVD
ncbi:hypothetical protein BDZ97DRAFT_492351 [Flammula alnicola]|nr:hypothetical protein BDZ97DRAFT_492351 [Flammula alnicola]